MTDYNKPPFDPDKEMSDAMSNLYGYYYWQDLPGYEWVFEDETVTCQEKIDGTNVSIILKYLIPSTKWICYLVLKMELNTKPWK